MLLDRGGPVVLACASLGLSALGPVLVLELLWVDWDDETLWKSALSVTACAVARGRHDGTPQA